MTLWKSARSSSSNRRSGLETPALFTMTCRPPNFSTAAATSAPTCSGSETSVRRKKASAPSAAASCLTPVGLDVGDDDPRALGHKPLHYAATDARGPAGDDGDLAIQFVDHTTS